MNTMDGPDLVASNMGAEGQEGAILAYFKKNPTSNRTGREIRLLFGFEQGSVSRSLTSLTIAGDLEMSRTRIKCNVTKKQVHTWRLAKREPPKPKQERLF